MIFVRSTVREFTATGIAVFLVLLVITFTTQLIRLLGFAAGGGIPTDAVLVLLGFCGSGISLRVAVGDACSCRCC